jgi:ATP-dependent Clp protease ATP-binding subunit ClpB
MRVIEILARRTKNNPILIGEPGTGKTAIAEGLAIRMAKGDVPESLKGKDLVLLDIGIIGCGNKIPWRIRGAIKIYHERN